MVATHVPPVSLLTVNLSLLIDVGDDAVVALLHLYQITGVVDEVVQVFQFFIGSSAVGYLLRQSLWHDAGLDGTHETGIVEILLQRGIGADFQTQVGRSVVVEVGPVVLIVGDDGSTAVVVVSHVTVTIVFVLIAHEVIVVDGVHPEVITVAARHHLEEALRVAALLLYLLALTGRIVVTGDADVLAEQLVGVVVVEHLEAVGVADDAPFEVVEILPVIHQSLADAQLRPAVAIDHLSALAALDVVVHKVVPVLIHP